MIRKLILLIFVVLSTIGLTGWRIYLLGEGVEAFNGFFKPEFSNQGFIFALALVGVMLVASVFAVTDKHFPGSPRRTSISVAILNLCYTMMILLHCFDLINKVEDTFGVVLLICAVAFGSFMIYYAMCMFNFKRVFPVFCVLPLLYFVVNLAYSFINSFGVVKSNEIIFEIVALVFCVMFFLCYARYISKLQFYRIRKVTLAIGICTFITTAVYSFSNLFAPLFCEEYVSRTELSDGLFMASTSLYVLLFLVFSFANKRLYSTYFKRQRVEYTSEAIDESIFGE